MQKNAVFYGQKASEIREHRENKINEYASKNKGEIIERTEKIVKKKGKRKANIPAIMLAVTLLGAGVVGSYNFMKKALDKPPTITKVDDRTP